jgi:hypothetical protein
MKVVILAFWGVWCQAPDLPGAKGPELAVLANGN